MMLCCWLAPVSLESKRYVWMPVHLILPGIRRNASRVNCRFHSKVFEWSYLTDSCWPQFARQSQGPALQMSVKLESFGVSASFESDRIGWKMIKHVRSKQWTVLIFWGFGWGCRGLSLDVVTPAIIRPCFSMFFCVFDRELARPNHAIGIESDRRSHCSDIELKYGDQKPNWGYVIICWLWMTCFCSFLRCYDNPF